MKPIRKNSSVLCVLIAAVLMAVDGLGQPPASPPSATGGVTGTFVGLPIPFRPLASALGDRLLSAGKERRTLVGTMAEAAQTYPCSLIQELPNKFRIDEGGLQPITVAFDGKSTWASYGNLTQPDQDMLESLFDDTPESLMLLLHRGAPARMLVNRGRMDDGSSPTYSGPLVTIYQLVAPPISRTDRRQKQFYFDSTTRLPVLVRYQNKRSDGRAVSVETSFTDWTAINGQFVPGKVMRSEDGKRVFTFQANNARFDAATDDGIFTKK